MVTCKNVRDALCDAYMHNDDNDDTGEARDKLTRPTRVESDAARYYQTKTRMKRHRAM